MRRKVSTLMVYFLVGFLAIGVQAYPVLAVISLGGGGITLGSIYSKITGTGAGNPDKKPSEIKFRTDFLTASVRCQNNGNQAETAGGTPFNVSGAVSGTAPITSSKVDKNGNFNVDNYISDAEINAAITVPATACKQNWSVVPGSVQLESFTQNFKAFYCTDLTCTVTTTVDPVDENTVLCTRDASIVPWGASCVVTFDAGGRLFTVNVS